MPALRWEAGRPALLPPVCDLAEAGGGGGGAEPCGGRGRSPTGWGGGAPLGWGRSPAGAGEERPPFTQEGGLFRGVGACRAPVRARWAQGYATWKRVHIGAPPRGRGGQSPDWEGRGGAGGGPRAAQAATGAGTEAPLSLPTGRTPCSGCHIQSSPRLTGSHSKTPSYQRVSVRTDGVVCLN